MRPDECPGSSTKTRPPTESWRSDGLVSPPEDEGRTPRVPHEGSTGQTPCREPVFHATSSLQRNIRHTPSRGRLWFAEFAEPHRLHSLSGRPRTPVGYLDGTAKGHVMNGHAVSVEHSVVQPSPALPNLVAVSDAVARSESPNPWATFCLVAIGTFM